MRFIVLRKEIQKHADRNDLVFRQKNLGVNIYSPNPRLPLQAIITIDSPVICKVIFDTEHTIEFYFQKPNLPDEIDYTSFRFNNTDNIDEHLSGSILQKYPNARLLHGALSKAFSEKEELDV